MAKIEQKKNYDGMLVIGAGLPRTGTTTMKSALGTLLDGSCYHMVDNIHGTAVDREFWEETMDLTLSGDKRTREQWADFLEKRGFNSCVDFPTSLFYK